MKKIRIVLAVLLGIMAVIGMHFYPSETQGFIGNFGKLFIPIAIIGIYFLPSGIAFDRKHRNLLPIFILNLFLGWTLLFWVGALIWATLQEKNS